LEKNQTRELVFSFKLILIGIFFWVIKVKYFTFFWLPEFHILNIFGFEIIGTILILIGVCIIHRIYPFAFSNIARVLIIFILLMNISDFIFFRYKIFRDFQLYAPFIMSLMLVLISKLMQSGLRYFGNRDLSHRWMHFSTIILFGFSLPYYLLISAKLCGFIQYDDFQITPKFIILFSPVAIIILSVFIYFIVSLVMSFNFLNKVQKDGFPVIKNA
jgi:hypothetical protein